MSKSKWKIPYVNNLFECNVIKSTNHDFIFTCSRQSLIESSWVGLKIKVHNGKKFVLVNVQKNMVGFKLGTFVYTRKICVVEKLKN